MGNGIIVQCRMSSTRLPGKILRPVLGKPMLQYVLESLSRCGALVVAATSSREDDDPMERLCRDLGVTCHRGPLDDVAGRFAGAVREFGFTRFARVCGDSPLVDHRLVAHALDLHAGGGYTMVTNVGKRTFPKGQSVEVVDAAVFLELEPTMSLPEEREHVTPALYARLAPERIMNFESGGDWGGMQMSVDTAEDMERFQRLAGALKRPHWDYTWRELVSMAEALA